MADISVVICAYTARRWPDLLAAISSVKTQKERPLETIVVVDHNPELLARLAEASESTEGVVLVENVRRRGLAGARNTGVSVARGEVVAFLDDDAVADPGWLERLAAPYEDRSVMGVGGAIEPAWKGGRPRWFPREFDWVVGCTYEGMATAPTPVRNMIGANMSCRRELFDAVGGFEEGMGRVGTRPLGCEETELCIRAQRRWPERRFLYEPGARVTHSVSADRSRWSYFYSRCYAEGLSKAQVARLAGANRGLASERSYAARTLPKGVGRGIGDACRGDIVGLARAFAIVVGLAVTTTGYLMGAYVSGRGRSGCPTRPGVNEVQGPRERAVA